MSKTQKGRFKRGIGNLLLALDTLLLFLSGIAIHTVGSELIIWKIANIITTVLFIALVIPCIKTYSKIFKNLVNKYLA
jgi:hypothetical protein